MRRSTTTSVLLSRTRGGRKPAATSYRRALAIEPDYVDALANLGNAYRDLGQFDQAVVHFQRALALDPNHVAIHNCLGVTLRGMGALDEAIHHYQQAPRR